MIIIHNHHANNLIIIIIIIIFIFIEWTPYLDVYLTERCQSISIWFPSSWFQRCLLFTFPFGGKDELVVTYGLYIHVFIYIYIVNLLETVIWMIYNSVLNSVVESQKQNNSQQKDQEDVSQIPTWSLFVFGCFIASYIMIPLSPLGGYCFFKPWNSQIKVFEWFHSPYQVVIVTGPCSGKLLSIGVTGYQPVSGTIMEVVTLWFWGVTRVSTL